MDTNEHLSRRLAEATALSKKLTAILEGTDDGSNSVDGLFDSDPSAEETSDGFGSEITRATSESETASSDSDVTDFQQDEEDSDDFDTDEAEMEKRAIEAKSQFARLACELARDAAAVNKKRQAD